MGASTKSLCLRHFWKEPRQKEVGIGHRGRQAENFLFLLPAYQLLRHPNSFMVTIREFSNQIEAGLIQSFLRDSEIEAILADENAQAWVRAPNLVPIRLQVPEAQAEQARALLAQFDDAPINPESGNE